MHRAHRHTFLAGVAATAAAAASRGEWQQKLSLCDHKHMNVAKVRNRDASDAGLPGRTNQATPCRTQHMHVTFLRPALLKLQKKTAATMAGRAEQSVPWFADERPQAVLADGVRLDGRGCDEFRRCCERAALRCWARRGAVNCRRQCRLPPPPPLLPPPPLHHRPLPLCTQS